MLQSLLPFALLGMALLVFGWVMFRLMIKRQSRGSRQPSPERQVRNTRREMEKMAPRDSDTALRDAPSEVLRWQVEMHETARDLKGELDTRIALLNATIRLADQKLDEMKEILARIEAHSSADGDPPA